MKLSKLITTFRQAYLTPHDAATLITAITTAVVAISGIVKWLITRMS